MHTFAKLYETDHTQIVVMRHPACDGNGPRVSVHFMPVKGFLVSLDMEWSNDEQGTIDSKRYFDDMTEEKAVDLMRRVMNPVEE